MLEFITVLILVGLLLFFLYRSEKQKEKIEVELSALKEQQNAIVASKAKEIAMQMVNENEIIDEEKNPKGKGLISVSELEQNPVLMERFANNFKGWAETN